MTVDVRELMDKVEDKAEGYYQEPGYSKRNARERRAFLEGFLEAMDSVVAESNNMDRWTRAKYNDLRGQIINLIDEENRNVKFY